MKIYIEYEFDAPCDGTGIPIWLQEEVSPAELVRLINRCNNISICNK